VVVAAEGQADRYVVIDGYKRIAALEQLGRDTVEAVVWPMSEAAAVLLDRSLRCPNRRPRWRWAGCWPSWSSASAMAWMSWRGASTAA
jgi:hypothetical protein